MSSSSFLARPRMYFSESVVAMAYGVPAMLTLTLFTMVFSPFYPVSVRRKAVCSAFYRDLAPFPVTFRLSKTFRRSFLCHYCRNYSPKNVSRFSSIFYYNINTPQEKVEFLKFRHICQKVARKNSSYGKKAPSSLHLQIVHIIITLLCWQPGERGNVSAAIIYSIILAKQTLMRIGAHYDIKRIWQNSSGQAHQ